MVTLADWTGDKTRDQYEEMKATLDPRAPGAPAVLPGWRPDMPFGLVSFKSSLSVRNVVVTPLQPRNP